MIAESASHFDREYYEGNEQCGDRIALRVYAGVINRLALLGCWVPEYG